MVSRWSLVALCSVLAGCGALLGEDFEERSRPPGGGPEPPPDTPGSPNGGAPGPGAEASCSGTECSFVDVGFSTSGGACALLSTGQLYCWYSDSNTAYRDVLIEGDFVDVVYTGNSSRHFACARTKAGEARCFRLWASSQHMTPSPTPPGQFAQLAVSGETFCGAPLSGGASCWEYEYDTQGSPTLVPNTDLFLDGGPFDQLTTAGAFICGHVPAGDLIRCAALRGTPLADRRGRLGSSGVTCILDETSYPACRHIGEARPAPKRKLTRISSTEQSACGIDEANAMYCWSVEPNQSGAERAEAGTFLKVSVDYDQWCAVTTDHRIVCRGENTPPPPRMRP